MKRRADVRCSVDREVPPRRNWLLLRWIDGYQWWHRNILGRSGGRHNDIDTSPPAADHPDSESSQRHCAIAGYIVRLRHTIQTLVLIISTWSMAWSMAEKVCAAVLMLAPSLALGFTLRVMRRWVVGRINAVDEAAERQ